MPNAKKAILSMIDPHKLVQANGLSVLSGPSHVAMLHSATEAAVRGEIRQSSEDLIAAKRARLMLAAKCNIYVTESEAMAGGFQMIDPEQLPPGQAAEAGAAGFTERTLIVHVDDIDRAIAHFEAEAAGKRLN